MNKITLFICAFMLFVSCTESSTVKYVIRGTTANVIDGEKVYLKGAGDDRTFIDSTTVNNNSFTFKGTQPKIRFVTIILNKMKITFILEDGIINVSFDSHKKITGTPLNNILNACKEKINVLDDELNVLRKQMDELKEDQIYEMDALKKKLRKVSDKRIVVVKECINQNLDNIVGAYLLNWHANILSEEEIIEILNNASSSMKENSFAQIYLAYKKAWELTEVRQKFTDFKMKDPNDKEVALSDYVGKGKYVLIDFWASWCGPCREEMPNVKAVYEKFASKGFEIVGVSLDSKKEDWLKGIQDLGITWPQMSDLKVWKCEGVKIYGIRGIPSTLLIDPNGVIIAKNLRGEAIEKKLSEVLK